MPFEEQQEVQYIGFWWRVCATIVDTILVGIIAIPILLHTYGDQYWQSEDLVQGPLDFLLTWVAPAIVVILFWMYKAATPGKMAISAKIVDAQTGERPSTASLWVGTSPISCRCCRWASVCYGSLSTKENKAGMTNWPARW